MAANKTQANELSVDLFLAGIANESKRNDCQILIKLMEEITQLPAKMWGSGIIGFGQHHYRYESGREGDSPNIAFSPRTSSIAIYLSGSLANRDELLSKLGKHKTDKGCVHIKSLSYINVQILTKLIQNHLSHIQTLYP